MVVQDDMLYEDVLSLIRPDYVIHGDNWRTGPESAIRAQVKEKLEAMGGQLIEVPYTSSERVRKIDRQLREKLAMPEYRAAGTVFCFAGFGREVDTRPILEDASSSECARW